MDLVRFLQALEQPPCARVVVCADRPQDFAEEILDVGDTLVCPVARQMANRLRIDEEWRVPPYVDVHKIELGLRATQLVVLRDPNYLTNGIVLWPSCSDLRLRLWTLFLKSFQVGERLYGSTSPRLIAYRVRPTRSFTPTLRKMWPRWASTVFGLMQSVSAISLAV